MFPYRTFLSKCSQHFIDLIDLITSKNLYTYIYIYIYIHIHIYIYIYLYKNYLHSIAIFVTSILLYLHFPSALKHRASWYRVLHRTFPWNIHIILKHSCFRGPWHFPWLHKQFHSHYHVLLLLCDHPVARIQEPDLVEKVHNAATNGKQVCRWCLISSCTSTTL